MDSWQLKLTPQLSGQANMDYDRQLFNDYEDGKIPSTIRIYSWKPKCITLGYAQKVDRWIKGERAREGKGRERVRVKNEGRNGGWEIVKRPTGGGIVFHNEAEVTYSIVTSLDNPILPKGLVPAYKKLSEAVVYALREIGVKAEIRGKKAESRKQTADSRGHLCFSFPAEYEIVVDGKKIVGSAQKRGKKALLQQGSIFMAPTDKRAFSMLKSAQNNLNAISVEEVLERKVSFDEMAKALTKGFRKSLGLIFRS